MTRTLDQRTPGPEDAVHEALVKAIEREKSAWLWVPSDAITFTPRVLPTVFGDGRALFSITTNYQRPAYWVIRGCSSWGCGFDAEKSDGADFIDVVDDVITELEEAFGSARCGYSGASLFTQKDKRDCQCDECQGPTVAQWPMVDDEDGCSWRRMDWPEGFDVVPNPLSWRGNLLRV